VLDKILGLLQQGALQQGAANPFQGFLGELWKLWAKDAGRAVLFARWYWKNLPADLAQQAAVVQQRAQAAQMSHRIDQEADAQINAQLGAMGIFSGSSGSPSLGLGMNPDHAIFTIIMGTIRAHQGDPPASQDLAQVAEAVLQGKADPIDALLATVPAFTRQQMAAGIQVARMMGADRLFRLQGVIQAASALPRARIPVLIPEIARADNLPSST
jgi:hypothetical protein